MSTVYASLRPAQRCFVSPIIDQVTREVSGRIKDREVAWLFGNCFPNTLDTTVDFCRDAKGRPDSFVITGDIDAMWLRDSTNQVWPYLPYLGQDATLREMVAGLVRRQMEFVQLDPYANAFYKDKTRISHWSEDNTEMRPGVHERKYELDSLCAVLRLAEGYHANTGDFSWFTAEWLDGLKLILDTIEAQQDGTSYDPPYRFTRSGDSINDTLTLRGHGQPAWRCGLSKSPFRPSDDSAQLPFLIPANAMAVVNLRRIAAIVKGLPTGEMLAARALKLADSIDAGIRQNAVVTHRDCGDILAFEVDGYGSHYLMDDANVPSLISLPYLGYMDADDPLYERTREFALSGHNPYYFAGKAGRGIGGPHVGLGYIWPMAIVMQALTSTSEKEVVECIGQLKRTHGGTGFIHETFWKDDPTNFTRKWFAWSNTLFGELILHVEKAYPGMLEKMEF